MCTEDSLSSHLYLHLHLHSDCSDLVVEQEPHLNFLFEKQLYWISDYWTFILKGFWLYFQDENKLVKVDIFRLLNWYLQVLFILSYD